MPSRNKDSQQLGAAASRFDETDPLVFKLQTPSVYCSIPRNSPKCEKKVNYCKVGCDVH